MRNLQEWPAQGEVMVVPCTWIMKELPKVKVKVKSMSQIADWIKREMREKEVGEWFLGFWLQLIEWFVCVIYQIVSLRWRVDMLL